MNWLVDDLVQRLVQRSVCVLSAFCPRSALCALRSAFCVLRSAFCVYPRAAWCVLGALWACAVRLSCVVVVRWFAGSWGVSSCRCRIAACWLGRRATKTSWLRLACRCVFRLLRPMWRNCAPECIGEPRTRLTYQLVLLAWPPASHLFISPWEGSVRCGRPYLRGDWAWTPSGLFRVHRTQRESGIPKQSSAGCRSQISRPRC